MNVEVDPLIEALYYWSDVSGVLLMGIIGGTLARQRGYDIVGFFFIAMFSSLGGGMIRDVLINRGRSLRCRSRSTFTLRSQAR